MRASRFARSLIAAIVPLTAMTLAVPTTSSASSGASSVRVIVRMRHLESGANIGAIAAGLVEPSGGRLTAVYQFAIQGFAAELPEAAAAALARNPLVAAVTPDRIVSITASDPEIPTGIDRIEGDRNVPGGPVDADIAIIDTGVEAHADLNIVATVDCTPLFGLLGCVDGNQGAVHWHATHVAGIAAALDNGTGVEGAAPGARIWSVRVLDANGSGYLSQIMAGVDWVTARSNVIDVANMSLAGAFSDPTFDAAISNSVAAGVVYAVAAGNDNADASGFSPANHPDVLTVSAIADSDGQPGGAGGSPSCRVDQDDTLADFSNFGAVVDIAAPGVCILSTYPGGYAVASGTSMATPHVAGVIARYLAATGVKPRSASDVAAVKAAIIDGAIPQASACGFTGDRDLSAEPLVFLNAVALGGDGSCGGSPPANGVPAITWETPAADAVVAGNVTVAALVSDAEDPPSALTVAYRVASGPWQPMSLDSGHFIATWDTTTAVEGPTTLQIKATDTAANSTTVSRSVVVDNVVSTPMALGAVSAELAGRRNTDLVATVQVQSNGTPVSGAAVSGYFLVNGSPVRATGTTGTTGVATLQGGKVRRQDFVTYFCVDAVTAPGRTLTTALPYCVLVNP